MVLLCVAIVSKSKTLVARQFVEMSRIRVEGLLTTFPKLLGTGKDYTFIETETARYVYQPIEHLYLVVVTNKASIIMEDLETLKLLVKVVQETCQLTVTEDLIRSKAFDLIFAFDEVVSFGYRENVTMPQINSYIEMDSHEEKLARMIEAGKLNVVREEAKRKAAELKKLKKDGKLDGISSTAYSGGGAVTEAASDELRGLQVISAIPPSTWDKEENALPTHTAKTAKKGLALGQPKKPDYSDFTMTMDAPPVDRVSTVNVIQTEEPPAPTYNPLKEPVSVLIEEQIVANLHAEGGLNGEVDIQGKFDIIVGDPKADRVCFLVGDINQGGYRFKGNPVLNKQSQAAGLLEPKDPSRPAYAVAASKTLLKWMLKSQDEEKIPITLSCWPSPTPDGASVVLEYELTDDNVTLTDVHIRFPCPANARANIVHPDRGQAVYDAAQQQIHWKIEKIDASDNNGTLEFAASCDSAMLLPFTFTAESNHYTAPVRIQRCYQQTNEVDLDYDFRGITSYQFTIGA